MRLYLQGVVCVHCFLLCVTVGRYAIIIVVIRHRHHSCHARAIWVEACPRLGSLMRKQPKRNPSDAKPALASWGLPVWWIELALHALAQGSTSFFAVEVSAGVGEVTKALTATVGPCRGFDNRTNPDHDILKLTVWLPFCVGSSEYGLVGGCGWGSPVPHG